MKKLTFLFVLLVSSLVVFSACGSSPDHTEDQIKVFLDGKGYNHPYKIFKVESEAFSSHSPYFRKENSTDKSFFDYIVLTKKENNNFLLFIESDGNFPEIVRESMIDSVATIRKPKGTMIR
ncbi:MAG: hypothetical protein WC849_00480 [Candidatus Paceibacterota bacterium]